MNFKGEFLDSLLGLVSPKRQRKVPRTAPRSPAFSGSNPCYSMQAGSNPQPPGVENRGNFPRLLADLHCGPTCYIASGDIQGNWVACSRLREHVSASPEAGALHAHVRVSMARKEDPNRGGDRRGVSKFSTTEDEARITHLHTRNRPCSIALRRHSGHVITTFLAVFSVVGNFPGALLHS